MRRANERSSTRSVRTRSQRHPKLIAKSDPSKRRFLQDSSQYQDGLRTGVNSVIDYSAVGEVLQARTGDVMRAAAAARDCCGSLARGAVVDLANYFRELPLSWEDSAHNLVAMPQRRVLRDTRLSMGSAVSPCWATMTSTAIARVL